MSIWLVLGAHGFKPQTRYNLDKGPCPTIAATGVGSYKYWFETDDMPKPDIDKDKPPYQVPSMAEIAALPWNGLKVVSTFAGAGGSCLGFKMAGYRVLWASEFNANAVECHRLNFPDCTIDNRDVREVQAAEILAACNLKPGELDVFNGSPPCDSFSTAGKREKGWGKVKDYSGGKRQRTDDLFFEYIRLLKGLRPKVFVAENVSGMVKGKAKGYFKLVLAALKGCGYNVKARLLDAQWLGVPQMRQRVIFLGVREDLRQAPAYPKPLPYRYSVRDALPWVSKLALRTFENTSEDITNGPARSITTTSTRSGYNRRHFAIERETDISRFAIDKDAEGIRQTLSFADEKVRLSSLDCPSPSLTALGLGARTREGCTINRRKFTIAELKRICAFPDDFQLVGSYAEQWARLGMSVPPVMMFHIAKALEAILIQPIEEPIS